MTIQFQNYQAVNNDIQGKTLYEDIIRHCKDWQHFADKSSKYTTAHETTHGINNDLRNASGNWEKKNGFYVGANRAIILDEPDFHKSDIIPFIPKELQSARFSLYIQGQQSWDDKPLYIYDEGVAYINGAWAAIELKEQENYVESYQTTTTSQYSPSPASLNREIVSRQHYKHYPYPRPFPVVGNMDAAGNTIVDGHIEFIPYMTAVLMCAHSHTALDIKLTDFSRWLFRHATNAYWRCKKDGFPPFDIQDKLWETMKSDSIYAQQRDFLQQMIGFEFPDAEVPEDDNSPIPWTI